MKYRPTAILSPNYYVIVDGEYHGVYQNRKEANHKAGDLFYAAATYVSVAVLTECQYQQWSDKQMGK